MQSAIQLLINKYPALEYFNILQTITQQQLEQIAPELSLPFSQMSLSSKKTYKQIRQYASASQEKFKQSRSLYRTLKQSSNTLESIILNNSNLKNLQALQQKVFQSLTEIQFSSNDIRSISPLKRMKALKMQYVDINSNCIQKLCSLNQVQWPKLKYLLLNNNKITSIQSVSFSSFVTLKHLDLSDNFIVQAKILRKQLHRQMKLLKHINLQKNQIIDLSWLSQCDLHRLQKLNLRNNKYPSFLCLQKFKMEQGSKQSNRIYNSNYEISVSSIGNMSKYMFAYRINSGHKLSIQVQKYVQRSKRSNIQKSRKLILF